MCIYLQILHSSSIKSFVEISHSRFVVYKKGIIYIEAISNRLIQSHKDANKRKYVLLPTKLIYSSFIWHSSSERNYFPNEVLHKTLNGYVKYIHLSLHYNHLVIHFRVRLYRNNKKLNVIRTPKLLGRLKPLKT